MFFYCSKPEPLGQRGNSGHEVFIWINLEKDNYAMLLTKSQANEANGSEEEDFLNFIWYKLKTTWGVAILVHETFI